jgi:small ligand-binding sensory domain FIST
MSESKAFVSALSTRTNWRDAVAEGAEQVRAGLGGSCDLLLVFATELFPGLAPAELAAAVKKSLPARVLLGCNSSGVIGSKNEVEMEPAITLMGMRLPGVRLTPFAISPDELARTADAESLIRRLEVFPSEQPKFIALAEPMSCDVERWVGLFNESYPGCPMVGGLASGLAIGKPNWLVLDDETFDQGSVGVALSGDVTFDVVVAQGCRPIGTPLIVTKAEGHILYELGGKQPLEVLRDVIGALSPEDQELARHSLFAGVVMNERGSHFSRGDFLIRNIMGYDAQSGALMVGTSLRPGQTVQFQLRDARTSDEDLKSLLDHLPGGGGGARGALLVSCVGRGKGLYGRPDHDTAMIQSMRGPLALAGFFANGELGPVGRKNYVHGYTSSLAVIR